MYGFMATVLLHVLSPHVIVHYWVTVYTESYCVQLYTLIPPRPAILSLCYINRKWGMQFLINYGETFKAVICSIVFLIL